MLDTVEVLIAGLVDSLRLPLEDTDSLYGSTLDYTIRDISGLDPVDADFATSTYAKQDGYIVTSSRRDGRNIVLTLAINTDYADRTVQYLRNRLYRYFMPKQQVTLRFYDTEAPPRQISGVVESLEAPLFTAQPSAQISILCPSPDFYSEELFAQELETTPLGTRDTIEYTGTSPTGVNIFFNPTAFVSNIRFEIQSEVGAIQTLTIRDEINGPTDSLIIDTRPLERRIELWQNGVNKGPITYRVQEIASEWPMLYPGVNYVRAYSVGNIEPYTISWTTKYGGL